MKYTNIKSHSYSEMRRNSYIFIFRKECEEKEKKQINIDIAFLHHTIIMFQDFWVV